MDDQARGQSPKMPPPEVYEQEYAFWPWGDLLRQTADWVVETTPPGSFVIDYMCGTGFLLHEISRRRSDLRLAGCTLEPKTYVDYAKLRYPGIVILFQDALVYQPASLPDVIICTAGIHHLQRECQPLFIEKVASELSPGGLFFVGEEVLRSYVDETERRLSALEVNTALMRYAIRKDASDDVIRAGIDLISNDVFENGEYKISLRYLQDLLEAWFDIEECKWVWPTSTSPDYGDVLLRCKRK